MALTPFFFMMKYISGIWVKTATYNVPVCVSRYRNNSMSGVKYGCDHWQQWSHAIRDAIKAKVKSSTGSEPKGEEFVLPSTCGPLYNAFSDHTYRWIKLVHVFTGKGSPEEIAEVLAAAVAVDIVKPENLQKMIDDAIGLDCNGFVGNWAAQAGVKLNGSPAGSNTPSLYYCTANKTRQRRKIEDMRQGDVLIWIDHNHVTVVDHVISEESKKFLVCESSNAFDGLRASYYKLLDNRQDVEDFTVENRLLTKKARTAMQNTKKSDDDIWKDEASKLGVACEVWSYDRGTPRQWVVIHGQKT